jgi:hypothetical protein
MLDINSLKSGQMLRYSAKHYLSQECIESLWILLGESEAHAARRPGERLFKMYQIYDSHNNGLFILRNQPTDYVFNSSTIKNFVLESA